RQAIKCRRLTLAPAQATALLRNGSEPVEDLLLSSTLTSEGDSSPIITWTDEATRQVSSDNVLKEDFWRSVGFPKDRRWWEKDFSPSRLNTLLSSDEKFLVRASGDSTGRSADQPKVVSHTALIDETPHGS